MLWILSEIGHSKCGLFILSGLHWNLICRKREYITQLTFVKIHLTIIKYLLRILMVPEVLPWLSSAVIKTDCIQGPSNLKSQLREKSLLHLIKDTVVGLNSLFNISLMSPFLVIWCSAMAPQNIEAWLEKNNKCQM